MDGQELLLELDRAAGSVVEASVVGHRRRLLKFGWSRALAPTGDEIWAGGEPPPRPGHLVDGAEACPAMAEAIAGAREYVHLAGGHVAPARRLLLANGLPRTDTLLAVRSVCQR